MSYWFGVDFIYENTITVDGETYEVDLHAHLTAHVNLEDWNLDDVDGHIIADGDYIPLVGKPELALAFRNFLLKDQKFIEYAQDKISAEYDDHV